MKRLNETNNKKHNELVMDAITAIIDALENGYNGYYCDLHSEVFNTELYISGAWWAKISLTEYGVFDALDLVVEYEKDNFGEVYTDITNPVNLVNMLYYVIGDMVLAELFRMHDLWSDNATEEVNNILIKALKDTYKL